MRSILVLLLFGACDEFCQRWNSPCKPISCTGCIRGRRLLMDAYIPGHPNGYPLDEIEQVPLRVDDLNDIVRADGRTIFQAGGRFLLADKTGMHKQRPARLPRQCVSYVDHCLGVLFDALRRAGIATTPLL